MKGLSVSILICVLVFSLDNPAQAQVGLNKVAQSTMNFLLVSVSPEASAMGEASMALGGGAESIFFNPAGIVESDKRIDVKVYVTRWIADINYMAGAAVWRTDLYGSFGVSLVSVDYGSIHGTRLLHPSEIDGYPAGYVDLGEVDNVSAYVVGITYGKEVSEKFLIGGSIRLAGQNLGQTIKSGGTVDNDATKLVFDAGVKYYTGLKSFRFGMAIRNFASNIQREEIEEQLPLTFSLGAALDLFDFIWPDHDQGTSMTLAADFVHPNNYSERLNLGLEYRLWNMIALRGGYQTNRDLASWSAGIGVNSEIAGNTIEFSYAYSDLDIFDGVNRFSIGFSF
jgi:hypothetical protein